MERLELWCSWEEMWLVDFDPGTLGGNKGDIESLETTIQNGTGSFSKDDGTITKEPPRKWGFFFKSGDPIKEDIEFLMTGDATFGEKVTPIQCLIILHVDAPEARLLRPFAVGGPILKQ